MSGQSEKTFFERAKECVHRIILRKIFNRPNDEIGIIIFGSENTTNDLNKSMEGYENVEELGCLEVPSWSMLKKVGQIKQTDQVGDWVDASIVAANYLRNEVMAKKFQNLRIILLTNFNAESNMKDIEVIADSFNEFGIELIGV
jgi:ATP-dependent DNA helicase 2 subunit 2